MFRLCAVSRQIRDIYSTWNNPSVASRQLPLHKGAKKARTANYPVPSRHLNYAIHGIDYSRGMLYNINDSLEWYNISTKNDQNYVKEVTK